MNPDHFAVRPTALGFTQLANSHIQLNRTQVDSQSFEIDEDTKVHLQLNTVDWSLLGLSGHLAPAFNRRIYLWVSLYENSQPIGSKVIGQTCTAPILWDLQRSDTSIWFATVGDERPLFRLDPGTYWMNFFYYGSAQHAIINRTIQSVSVS